MTNRLTISIIIPTLGRSSLKAVLQALIMSKNFDQITPEILVVFDGKKGNGEWLMVNSQFEQRVKFLKTGAKAYAAGARNLGLQHATGEVIAFIGDDTIPEADWLEQLEQWHQNHPQPQQALLGKVAWVERLAADPFHQWLEQTALFDYARLNRGLQPTWRHFYTSNVSVKRALLANSGQRIEDSKIQNSKLKIQNLQSFSESFQGWGFEDAEFGYRLAKRGMELSYDAGLIVRHDDEQTLEGLISRTAQARANAAVFEGLHPEVQILPRGLKLGLLKITLWASGRFEFVPTVKWWRAWKGAWLGCRSSVDRGFHQ